VLAIQGSDGSEDLTMNMAKKEDHYEIIDLTLME
jgi:hypothetical protein